VAALLLLAAFFRFYQLDAIPPGLHYDEAGEGLDALDMLGGDLRVFSETQGGREPLFAYLLALAFAVTGPQVMVLRGMGALAGTAAVGAAYLLTRELFRPLMPHRARWLATLTALGLATSYWQVHLTRMGLRHVLLPPLLGLGLYALWRGIHTERRAPFVWAGVLLGATLYTYLSARFVPIFLGLFFMAEGLVREVEGRRADALWRRHGRNLLLTAGIAAALFAPLGYYFLTQEPGEFAERAAQVSVFNPALNGGDLFGALRHSFTGNYGAIAFFGDEDGLVNLPGRPLFDPLMAAAFAIGLGLALWKLRHPAYLFVVLWWLVMMLPAALTYDRVPRFMRAIGAAPGIYILPALAWLALAAFLWQRRNRILRALAILIPAAAFVVSGNLTFRDYFLRWGPADIAAESFHSAYSELARKMVAEGRPDELWLFPTDLRINYPRRHRYILRFVGYKRLPPEKFLSVDETDMFGKLSAETTGKSRVVLVNMKTGLQWEADFKHVLPFVLEKYGRLEKTFRADRYDLLYYTLDEPSPSFDPAGRWQPVEATFGGGLRLLQASYGDASGAGKPDAPQAPSGETAWVTLRWQTDGPLPEDYQVSVRLVAAGGRVLAQVDKPLYSRWHIPPTGWHPGEEVTDYYLLPIPPGTLPAPYTLEVAVYSPATLQPLPAVAGGTTAAAAPIGALTVTPALAPPADLTAQTPLGVRWADGVTLVGVDGFPDAPLRPGDTLPLTLLWRAETAPGDDALFDITLRGDAGEVSLVANHPVGEGTFPTSRWRADETVRQPLDVSLPPNLSPGAYQMWLTDPASGASANPGSLMVRGRARRFALPADIPYPLQITLGNQILLAGYGLEAAEPNRLRLTLYWQARETVGGSYTVFAHVLDRRGQIVAQQDRLPLDGEAPTSGWLPGEVVIDAYTFNVPPGAYRVAIGMYDAVTGARLPIPGTPDDRLVLPATIVVKVE